MSGAYHQSVKYLKQSIFVGTNIQEYPTSLSTLSEIEAYSLCQSSQCNYIGPINKGKKKFMFHTCIDLLKVCKKLDFPTTNPFEKQLASFITSYVVQNAIYVPTDKTRINRTSYNRSYKKR